MYFTVNTCVLLGLVLSATSQTLTKLLEDNRAQDAKNASRVDPTSFLGVESYAGYVTVNKTYNSNMFFWYFPVPDKPPDTTPWIIWLQGGPGSTSLYGLFDELGPFQYNKELKRLERRGASWGRDFSLLFIDNPVGTGFSFTENQLGMSYSIKDCARNLYSTIRQFLNIFPELQHAPLYLAGESYAGPYVPALGVEIMEALDQETDVKINLQGVIMGNPTIDREYFANHSAVFYNWGLIDEQGVLAVKDLQDKYIADVKEGRALQARHSQDQLLDKLDQMSSQNTDYNVLKSYPTLRDFEEFVNENKDKLHVNGRPFTIRSDAAWKALEDTYLDAGHHNIERLLENYRVMIYCGHLDLIAPCVQTAEARRHRWEWSGRKQFLSAQRQPWWYKEGVAGFIKSGGGFTEVLVKGAGHLVPIDKPYETQELISSFILGHALPTPPDYDPDEIITPSLDDYYKTNPSKSLDDEHVTKWLLNVSVAVNVIFGAALIFGVVHYFATNRRRLRACSPSNSDDSILLLQEETA